MHTHPLSYWLAASHLPGIGPVKIRRWLKQCGDEIAALFSAPTQALQAWGLSAMEIKAIQHPDWSAVERDLAWSQKPHCHLIVPEDSAYPVLLQELTDSPLVLYLQGSKALLNEPQLAMVGSRNPTVMGKECAEQFANCLAQAGLVITSGLAYGIDAACHRGALAAKAKTLAVLGTGLNQIYPRAHASLAADIIQSGGALLAEFPPDTPPIAKNFPRRNRIISGLSLGVVVIEAALQSGSLITARFAVEQNREVFAIPGSIHNPLSRGCHKLIQQGAKLVEKAEDILEELGALRDAMVKSEGPKCSQLPQPNDAEQQILKQIGYEVTALDTIIIRSRLTASQVSSMLLSLELRGYVHRVTGGYVRN